MNIVVGNNNDAMIEPSDTYPEASRIRMKTATDTVTSIGAKDTSIPNAVLIPLPPLNFINIENVCPITALIPAMILINVISVKGV